MYNRAPCLASTRLELVCHQLLSSSSPAESNTPTANLYNIKRKHGGGHTHQTHFLHVSYLSGSCGMCSVGDGGTGGQRQEEKQGMSSLKGRRKRTHLSKQSRLPHAEGLCVTASNLPARTHHIGAMTHARGPGSNRLTAVLKRKCSQSVSISK